MKKLILALSLACCLEALPIRRAAIDVGSGGTKVTIADVEAGQIVRIHLDTTFQVPYQASLDKSSDGTFDTATKEAGLHCFKEIKQLADDYQVEEIHAIATSAFRKANNIKKFLADIKRQTGIVVKVIPQREEGEIAFFSALSTGQFDPQQLVVCDIGTGSVQITTASHSEGLTVYMGEQMGAVAFKNYTASVLQEDQKRADSYARAFARGAFPIIKEKIQATGTLVGIGRLFTHSVRPIASEEGLITRKALRKALSNALSPSLDVSNCILVLAIMKALHIQTIVPIETTTTRGLLLWE